MLPGATISFCIGVTGSVQASCSWSVSKVGGTESVGNAGLVISPLADPPSNGHLGFGWPVTWSFPVPSNWTNGLYQLQMDAGAGATVICHFVVRPPVPSATSKTLLLVDYITPQAYNGAGGPSLYDNYPNPVPRATSVSFDRPTGGQAAEPALISWLVANQFTFEVASMLDLHTGVIVLDPYDCVVFGNHCEYWSKEMRDRVETFVAKGGNVVSLSGNTCYRQVRFEAPNSRTLVCFKTSAADTNSDLQQQTLAFASPPVNRPPNLLLGAGWSHGGWRNANPPQFTPYTFRFPSHWALSGVTGGMTSSFMTYETDAAPFSDETEGYPRVTGEEGTPLSTVILGSAALPTWYKPGAATMSLYVRNGMVFHAGTTEWVWNLTPDANVSKITKNVLTRLRNRRTFDWELVGAANSVVCMAAADDKLFAGTSDGTLWRRYPVLADVVFRNVGGVLAKAMAGARGRLFAVDAGNALWTRPPVETSITWTSIGSGPMAGTQAMAALGSTLYAVDSNGAWWSRPATAATATWSAVPALPARADIRCLTAYNGVLFAATTGNHLIRSSFDFVEESTGWTDVWNCNNATALAVIDNMLFVTTTSNQLWWLDLFASAMDPRG